MWARKVLQIALCLTVAGVVSTAHALTQQELVAKLKAEGYSQIGEMKSSAEGNIVKAMKDGKEVHLIVDSSGQIKQSD